MDALGHLAQERLGNGLVGGELGQVDGDEKLLGLLVNISNVDTALVGEKDPVALKREVSQEDRVMIGRKTQ